MDCIRLDEKCGIQISAYCEFKGKKYGITHYTGLIVTLDFDTGQAKLIDHLENFEMGLNITFSYCILPYREELIIIPFDYYGIVFFNPITKSKKIISLPNDIKNIKMKFKEGIIYKNRLYLFGYYLHKSYYLDLIKMEFVEIDFSNIAFSRGKKLIWASRSVVCGDMAYTSMAYDSGVMVTDLKNAQSQFLLIPECEGGTVDILTDQNDLWIINRNGKAIVQYNVRQVKAHVINITSSTNDWPYIGGVLIDKTIYGIPSNKDNYPFKVDIETGEKTKITAFDKKNNMISGGVGITIPDIFNQDIVFFHEPDLTTIYSVRDKSVRNVKLYINELPKKIMDYKLYDERGISLQLFLCFIRAGGKLINES